MRSSNGRASPVRTVMLARAGFIMVIFWLWMVNARTSFFTARILAWNRNGLTLRSAGSSGMLPPVLFSGQGWCAVSQRVRRVHPFLLQSLWGTALWGFSVCSQGHCSYGGGGEEEYWLFLSTPSCAQYPGHAGVPVAGHALQAEVGGGIIFVANWSSLGPRKERLSGRLLLRQGYLS